MKQLNELPVDSKVWFYDSAEAAFYVAGTLVDRYNGKVLIHSGGRTHEIDDNAIRLREDTGIDGVDDMLHLVDLHEGSILHNIKKRYHRANIYTYIGNILISVNPYQLFPIYGLDKVREYENQLVGKLPPHIFAISNAAYYNMMKSNVSQVIIVSGESGSGKTESTKLVMQYLAAADAKKQTLITEQILESNPLLESFGNAKTVMNDNSSRFGKYIQVLFENGHIVGAEVYEYLLEKSRIVYQNQGDRNFHIFYEMLAGLPIAEQKEMGLTHADNFFYLNQGSSSVIQYKNDAQDFQFVISAMEVLGINSEERQGIFNILAAILHLGNIYYGRTQRNGQEAAVIMNHIEVDFIAKLLKVEVSGVAKSLTQKVTDAAGERFHTPFNVEQALDSRDGLAKALYSRLFTWLVSKINRICSPRYDSRFFLSISLLDIFGFENFKLNGFEQFCINYANEYLQNFLTTHIFSQEQKIYEEEEIEFDAVEYEDNQACLELIGKPPIGIIHILGDESNFPQATDRSFIEKCHQQHGRNKFYEKPKVNGLEFGIWHYAGLVRYQADMFLDKNRDIVRSELLDLLISSQSVFIANLFPEYVNNPDIHVSQASFIPSQNNVNHMMDKSIAVNTSLTRKNKFNMGYIPTVAGSFNESLHALIDKVNESFPFFIRCVRPNTEKSSVKFDDKLVMNQLLYSGTLETINVRRAGYPIRMTFDAFVRRYFSLPDNTKLSLKNDPFDNAKRILDGIHKVAPELKADAQLGQTKVFMREEYERFIEAKRFYKLKENAIIIQKNVKMWIAENEYFRKKAAIVILQSYVRGHLQRKVYRKALNGIIKFQSVFRMYNKRKFFLHSRRNEINRIAKRQKENLAQVHYSDKLEYEKIIDVTRFDIPPDLAVIFSRLHIWEPLHLDHHICGVSDVTPWDYAQISLPGDIDLYPMAKFAKSHFQDRLMFSYSRIPIRTSLLSLKYTDLMEAVIIFKLIIRFMDDPTMNGLRQLILGNYIVNKGIRVFELRDEIYSQLCMQTWKNPTERSLIRGWLLMGLCLCCFPPSQRMFKYLLKYVSDYGFETYKAYCQQKLLCWEKDAVGRLFPPSLLEWKALKEFANLSLECEMSDGYQRIIEVESSSSGESVAKSFLNIRDIADPAVTGWSFYVQFERSCRMDIPGSDPVFDLISVMEQPSGFPCSLAGSILSLDRSNPLPSSRRDIIIESHKPFTHRSRFEHLRETYSNELSNKPLVYQPHNDKEMPIQQGYDRPARQKYIPSDYVDSDAGMFDTSNEDSFEETYADRIYQHPRPIENKYALNEDGMINQQGHLLRKSYLEQDRKIRQLKDELEQQQHQQYVPPVPAPPPPVLPSASNPDSRVTSQPNTLTKRRGLHKKPPYSLDEVLERSNELKVKRDHRALVSSSSDPMLDNLNQRMGREFDLALHRKLNDLKSSELANVMRRPYQKDMSDSGELYSVGDMLHQNKAFVDSKAYKNTDRSFYSSSQESGIYSGSNSPKTSPSILGKSSGTLSRPSQSRFEHVAKMFENHKESMRGPSANSRRQPYPRKQSSVSAYVDKLFSPVFANEDSDLMSSAGLNNKLRGGSPNYYPARIYDQPRNYSSVSSDSSHMFLIDQLIKQQQYLQETLDNLKNNGRPMWDQHAKSFYREPQKTSFDNGSTIFSEEWRNIPPPPTVPIPPIPQDDDDDDENIYDSQYNRYSSNSFDIAKGFEVKESPDVPIPSKNIPKRLENIPNQDELESYTIRSILHSKGNESYLTYGNTRWKLYLKKEIFYPNEIMNSTLKHLIYRQILEDLGSRTCCRLSGEDRYKMQRLLARTMTQEAVINAAKDLPLYFSRLYRVNGYTERAMSSYLAVSHSGIRFATRANLDEELKMTLHVKYDDIIDVISKKDKLTLETTIKRFVLYTMQSKPIKGIIDVFMKSVYRVEKYVIAVSDFNAPDKDYLSFKKDAVIHVYDKKDIEVGCLWGILGDYRGKFPSSVVEPYEKPVTDGPGWGPSVIPKKITSQQFDPSQEPEQFSMVEFALRYFKHQEHWVQKKKYSDDVDDNTILMKGVVALVSFSKEPISGSLINFNSKAISRQAVDTFKVIMKFMGDIKREKHESNAELIGYIIKTGQEILDMRDEIYCQLAKQATRNRSDNRESCSRCWKLLMLCTAYFDCSQLLRPYLNKFFQKACDPKKEFYVAANICELNLTRSFKYGGRKLPPSENELFMLMQGKHSKHHIVHLPGGIQKLCKIQTSTTSYDVVKDICQEMGLFSELEYGEYGLFSLVEDDQLLLPIQSIDYIFDKFAQLEKEKIKYSLAFRKVIWYQTMRFGNNLFSEVIYNQILPDVLNGYILHHKGNRPSHIRDQQTQNEVALLAALQYRISEELHLPTVREISDLIPAIVSSLLPPSQWVQQVQDHFKLIKHFTTVNARTKYLELISAWAYFGSSFFYIKHCSHTTINRECILAINKNGVHFLAADKRDTLLMYNYDEIISTRHLRTDSGRMFVDLKCGNLMVQRVTRLETPRGKEISNLIGQYIRCLSRDKKQDDSVVENVN